MRIIHLEKAVNFIMQILCEIKSKLIRLHFYDQIMNNVNYLDRSNITESAHSIFPFRREIITANETV